MRSRTAAVVLGTAVAVMVPTRQALVTRVGAVARDAREGQVPRIVPFQLVDDFLVVVHGTIGEFRDLKFVIDTGTARTVIDEDIARTLAGARTRPAMHVFGEQVLADGVVVPRFGFGPVHEVDLPVLVADLEPQARRFGLKPDALVGLDVLGHHCFTIDYATAIITFECAGEGPAQAVFDLRSPYPVVEAAVGGTNYRLFVDSGSQAIVIFESAIPAGRSIRMAAGDVTARHLTGTTRLKRLLVERVSLGGHSIGRPPVFMMSGVSGVLGYDGVLGTRWIPGGRVHFDFERRVLSWWPLSPVVQSARRQSSPFSWQ